MVIGFLGAAVLIAAVWALAAPSRWVLLLFGALLLTPPIPGTSLHIAPVFAAVGLLAGILRWHAWRPISGEVAFAMLLFFGVLLASTAIAALYSGPEIAGGTLVRVLLFGQGVYLLLYTLCGPGGGDLLSKTRVLFWMAVATTIFACLDFHYQFPAPAGYGPQFVWLQDAVLRRAQGVFYEASTLGNLCAFFILLVIVAMFHPDGRAVSSRPILLAGGMVFSAALIFSYSRASIVSLIAGIAAFAWVRRIGTVKAVLVPAGLIALAALGLHAAVPEISQSYWDRITGSFQYLASSPDSVLSGRLTSWNTLAGFLAREPWNAFFGIGYKTLPYTRLAGEPIIADNTYLSLLVETGVTGLAAFLFLNAAILKTAWRAAHSARGHASFFGTWIFCFWTGQMVQMLSGDLITYWRVLPAYFWVLAAAAREMKEGV